MCQVCQFWHHSGCIPGMTNEFYQNLVAMKDITGAVYYACEKCQKTTMRLQQEVSALASKVESVTKLATKNEEDCKSNKELIEKVNRKVDNIQPNDEHAVSSVFAEMSERENR